MNTRRIVSRGGFIALVALLAACHGKQEPSVDIRPVRTTVVGTGEYGDSLAYTGEIRARHESDLGFQVAGKLIARQAEVGAAVNAGTVLARLDPADEKVAVDSAQSAVNAAQAELARATTEETSYRHLLERGLTTRTA
jgi:multidrug efflux system membrane fusion protein